MMFPVQKCYGLLISDFALLYELFKMMFPDSQIAQKFSCGKTKHSYLITHGLASYFHDRMLASLKDGDVKYVISFDESLNRT